MSTRLASRARSTGRKLAYGYATAGLALLTVLALRVDAFEGWIWGSLLILLFPVVSLRSALVFAYRKVPSKLNGWIRPTLVVEKEFTVMWLVYAVFFGVASLLIVAL